MMRGRKSTTFLAGLPLALLAGGSALADAPAVDGHVELVGPQATAYVAVPITVPPAMRLSGIQVALSDGFAADRVLLCRDAAGTPDVEGGTTIDENVLGSAEAWADVSVTEGVGAVQGLVWVVFAAAPAAEFSGEGDPGIGYFAEAADEPALCGDGEDGWGQLAGIRLAVQPQFEPYGGYGQESKGASGTTVVAEDSPIRGPQFLGVRPNPARETATFEFIQAAEGVARVDIFDARGRRVRSLGGTVLPAGQHALTWDRRATNGASVARGTYYARLTAPGLSVDVRVLALP